MSSRWHMMSEKQLSILIQGRNYARGNRQIIRIPRAFARIPAGAPWLWRSVMQIDKVSQETARLRMLTAPFYGTFFPIGSSQSTVFSPVFCPSKPLFVQITKKPDDCISWPINFTRFIAVCSFPSRAIRNSWYLGFAHIIAKNMQCKTWSSADTT